jgi:frataxin-like iron-binding protein CyaY
MSPNHKLTNALKGRTIANFETEGGALTLRFNDGATMRIKGAPQGSIAVPQGGQVAQAFEQGNRLALHFDNRTSMVVTLENPGNAISVRDGENKVLYLG